MLRLLILTATLMVIITLLTLGVCLISRIDSTSPSVLKDYLCPPQPCWHQIYPGKTQLNEAQSILREDPELNIFTLTDGKLCWKTLTLNIGGCLWPSGDGLVRTITLVVDKPFRVGDAIVSFGQPVGYRLSYIPTADVVDPPPVSVAIFFPGGTVVTFNHWPTLVGEQLTPYELINQIGYYPLDNQLDRICTWPGFSRLDRLLKSGCFGS